MRITLVAAAAAVLFSLAPLAASALGDPSQFPVSDGEQTARSCYMHAMDGWNATMASAPNDRNRLLGNYMSFAKCAKVSIDTGHVMRDGHRLPWRNEYFASTIGATYAQTRLATVTTGNEQCGHYTLARDLAQQALTTENETGIPNPQWEDQWTSLLGALKRSATACSSSVSRR